MPTGRGKSIGAYGLLKSMAPLSGTRSRLLQVCRKFYFFGNSKTSQDLNLCSARLLFYKSPHVPIDMFIFSSADAKSLISCILQYGWPCPSSYHTRGDVTVNSGTRSVIIFMRRKAFQARQTRRRACCG